MSSPFWLEALKLPLPSETQDHYDYFIIGAGIAGLSTAYWLQQDYPQARIAIIDRSSLGLGATGRNAGFVTCGSALYFHRLTEKFGLNTAHDIWTFSERNNQLILEHIIQGDPVSVDYKKTGSCTVIPRGSDVEKFDKILQDMKSVGIAVDKLDSHSLKTQYAVKESDGAIEYHNDGVIHPIKLMNKIVSRLKNIDYIWNEDVTQIQSEKRLQIKTTKKIYSAEKVFVCINAYVPKLFPELSALVLPQRGQIILTEPHAPLIKGPCYLTEYLCYFRQLPSGQILVGGFRNSDPQSENTDQHGITDKIQNDLENFVRNYFFQTQNIKITHRWSGIMGFTTDQQLIIGEHPQKPNVHIMAGCAGHGMGLSFHAAQAMVKNTAPDFFNIKRFTL